jgi:putative heme-binding domain-containing protein
LGEAPHPPAVDSLLEILTTTRDETVKMAVLTTLQAYNDPRIAPAVLTLYHEWGHDLRALAQSLLASRKASALALLGEVEAGRIDATSLLEETIRTIMLHRDDHISVIVKKHWENIDGGPTADMQEQFERGLAALGDQRGDPSAGKPLYMQLCGKCHSLHDLGGQIGPDLTVYDRNDVRHMLANIVNPSAEIREGFEGVTATLDDGRVVSGYLVEHDPSVLVMRTVDGQTISIRRDTIDEFLARRKSLMPENLLSQLSAIQIRDLFAYLRTSQPLP